MVGLYDAKPQVDVIKYYRELFLFDCESALVVDGTMIIIQY